ncbi:2-amino-4-hydroxy-6-hydroxymethyldihydropteridine diphosphokinase [Nocardia sp. CDC159]|uniref:2-amino-4-hydroxy-6-hydroxymethyldihydropteridine diphosphokinase n=1 Tax=Nocardia pulmonis TaxID=2951408 RepID=A0A9X2E2B3_9NOCA|nr:MULTISPECIES: 2-amino-4-hydroxy-6-hydroxymethyldihydropteridine diphosphokinase [Nocardia]MCM6772802.1 2-amino-4-hydroxy-6-hydroxymethyldihydropteridine diphosphokinase [Nocardia pulmonis]MCM6785895.1 2-amino-4-hydroxy-6-hydroxymethyldihydropteridine diphosphokinase [Nocardia sp. CDC159]
MSRAVLSIGSNLGDRLAHLRSVVDALAAHVVAASSVYSTAPWGGVPQQHYLNAVLVVDDPAAGPRDWLHRGQELERAAGRMREVRWGARTLDVDVLWCAERRPEGLRVVRSTDPTLTLPHPQAHNRAFVLVPWLEVEPDAVLEAQGRARPIRDWLAELAAAEIEGVRITELTLRAARP